MIIGGIGIGIWGIGVDVVAVELEADDEGCGIWIGGRAVEGVVTGRGAGVADFDFRSFLGALVGSGGTGAPEVGNGIFIGRDADAE